MNDLYVFVVDKSGSMNTVFKEIKSFLIDIIDSIKKINKDCSLSLIAFGSDSDMIFNNLNISAIGKEKINSIESGSNSTNFGSAIEKMKLIFPKSLDSSTKQNIKIVVISDGGISMTIEQKKYLEYLEETWKAQIYGIDIKYPFGYRHIVASKFHLYFSV